MDSATKSLVEKEYSHLSSIYFNSAYFGPSPIRAKASIEAAVARELDPSFYAYDDWMSISEKLRIKFAQILNVSPDMITHSTSSSDVVNIVGAQPRIADRDGHGSSSGLTALVDRSEFSAL